MSLIFRPSFYLYFVLILTSLIEISQAQDSHYWTNQYGTEAQLIGGLVVGSTSDLSSTFYNPGAISLSSDQTLVISTSAFEMIQTGLRSKSGRDLDLNSLQTRPAPGIFAFRFWQDSLQNDHLSVSVLTRRDSYQDFHNLDYSKQFTQISQEFVKESIAFNRLTETWFGFSFSHRMSKSLGIGITQYVAVRNQRERFQGIRQSINETGQGSTAVSVIDWQYTHIRLLWKAGFIIKTDQYSWGITVTTPGLNIYGNGSGYFNASIMGQSTDPELISVFSEDLNVRYRSPISIAVGGAMKVGKSTIYLGGEYFTPVDAYNLMALESEGINSPDQLLKLSHELEPVFNFGIGMAHKFTDLFSLYGSVITNHSGVLPDTQSDLKYSVYDIYHFSLGSSFSILGMMLTFGVAYGIGPEEDLSDMQYNLQYDEIYRISYSSIKLLFGFSTAIQ